MTTQIFRPSGGGSGGGAPTTATYITTASDATLSAEVVIPGLAVSPDIKANGGAGVSREFESGDTAPTQAPSNFANLDVGTTLGSHLYINQTNTTERFATYAWAPSGAFDARCKVTMGSTGTADIGDIALAVFDTTKANFIMVQATHDVPGAKASLSAYTFTAAAFTLRGSTRTVGVVTAPIYLRLVRDGSNNCSFYYSLSGLSWQILATQSFTFTPALIGWRIAGTTSAGMQYYIDYLRTDV